MNCDILPPVAYKELKDTDGALVTRKYYYDFKAKEVGNPADVGGPVASAVSSLYYRYELTKRDIEIFTHIKQKLHAKLSGVLWAHDLKFYYRLGGGPEERNNHSDGKLFWIATTVKNWPRIRGDKHDAPSLYINAAIGHCINIETGETLYRDELFTSFIIRVKPASHDYLKIPEHGVGRAFYLEELLVRFETDIPTKEQLADWQTRLDWHCEMIQKHQEVVFKPMPSSLLEAIFDSIRARAIRLED